MLLLGLAAALGNPATGLAGPDFEPVMRGRWPNRPAASLKDVAVSGRYVCLALDEAGIELFDFAEPTEPQRLGSLQTSGQAWHVDLAGTRAYVVGPGSFEVVDRADPNRPRRLFQSSYPGLGRDIVVRGNYAYVADGDLGLSVYALREGGAPQRVGGIFGIGATWGLALQGDYAFVAAGSPGLVCLDIHDPANPQSVGVLNTPVWAYDVAVAGTTAYVADGGGLLVADIQDPKAPRWLTWLERSPGGTAVEISGDRLVASSRDGGLWVYNIADRTNPQFIETALDRQYLRGLTTVGDYLHIFDYAGLRTFALGGTPELRLLSRVNVDIQALAVAAAGNYAYVAAGDSGVHVIDCADPTQPRRVGGHTTLGNARDLVLAAARAYVADDYAGLTILDITDPVAPRRLGRYDTPGQTVSVAISGAFAGLADGPGGFRVVDITDPAMPKPVGQATNDPAWSVAVSGRYAYVVTAGLTANALVVYDLRSSHPAEAIDLQPMTNPSRVMVDGQRLYVSDRVDGTVAFDLTTPARPQRLRPASNAPAALAVISNYVYTGSVSVWDFTDPAQARWVGTSVARVPSVAMTIDGDRLFVAGGGYGLTVMDRLGPPFQLTVRGWGPDQLVRFTVQGTPGRTVWVEYSRDLMRWFSLGGVYLTSNLTEVAAQGSNPIQGERFYRAIKYP